jgi:hypothetical protein
MWLQQRSDDFILLHIEMKGRGNELTRRSTKRGMMGGQRSNYAAVKDVQVKFIVEECARSMLQRSSNAAGRDAQTMLKREEYAPDMEHLRSNSLLCMPFLLVTSYYHLVHPVTKFAPRFHFQMSWKHDISLQLQ